jgi:hypothetical protein
VRNKPILALTMLLVVATSALASAFEPQIRFQPDHKSATKAGVVGTTGSIVAGTGFSVSHDGTGEYTLDVPAGKFKNCPVVLVTPAGLNGHAPIPDDYDYSTCGNNGEVKIQIRIYSRTNGALQDNAFHFAMIQI